MGRAREDFGLADLFGVTFRGRIEGPMQNSYLRLETDPATGKRHPLLAGLEDAPRIINGVQRVEVTPPAAFPRAAADLIPAIPTCRWRRSIRACPENRHAEVYLRESGMGRVVYFPWDIDRTFWEVLCRGSLQTAAQRRRVGDQRRAARHGDRARGARRDGLAAEEFDDRSSRQPDQSHDDEGAVFAS